LSFKADHNKNHQLNSGEELIQAVRAVYPDKNNRFSVKIDPIALDAI
jgi:hypothetical protein